MGEVSVANTIEEMMLRREPEDIIYIGNLVEAALNGEFGVVMRALLNGRKSDEARASRADKVAAERALGRIEMCVLLEDDLEQFVIDRDKMIMEIKKQKDRDEAGEPVVGPE